MGVLHMAIPFSSGMATFTPTRRSGGPQPPATPQRTLPPSLQQTPLPPEVRLQRTPEQQAEQEALQLLVARCIAGDNAAWNQMVKSQHKRVYALCYRFTGNQFDAEDTTQDVFLKVYRNLKSYDATKGGFGTWLTTLTRNMLVDQFRRTRLERATDSLDETLSGEEDGPTAAERLADTRPSQEQAYAGLELKARIQAALAEVSPELREAVILRDLEDMDYKEIAVVLKIPEGTVKSRISRGRGELARLLQRTEGQVM